VKTWVIWGALAVATACGGKHAMRAFEPEWQSDGGASIASVQARLKGTSLPIGAAVAIGVTSSGLVGIGLDGSGRWAYSGPVDARPALTGDVVVLTGGGKVVALDAKSGRQLWQVPSEGRRLRGAGDDGQTTAVSLGNPHGGSSLFLAVQRSGAVRLKMTPEPDIGAPGVIGDVAFIPWGSQYVSAIDLATGQETGRLLGRIQMSRATNLGGQLYFGESSLLRFDDQVSRATDDRGHLVSLPQRELPGKPRWFSNGTEVQPPAASALDKVQIYARPAAEAALDSERYFATYFRVALGFHSTDGTLRWVHSFPKDILGGAAATDGVALCDVSGKIWVLGGRSGGDAGSVALGAPVSACLVQAGAFKSSGTQATKPFIDQLTEAIQMNASDMLTIQRFLIREAGTRDEPEVTKMLVELASDGRTPPALASDARDLLASRRTGEEYMLEALKRRHDFLEGVLRPPPVGPLADALAAMKESRAAPLLAEQLNDPANTPDDVKRAAKALVTLGTTEELDDIRTFFSLYRGTAEDKAMVEAVISAARALVRLGGEQEAELVRHAANDPLTVPAVKQGIANIAPRQG
jgi:outer membrane protein assembly factor BamB